MPRELSARDSHQSSLHPRVCFVSLRIFPVLSGKFDVEIVGGAELQQTFIGKALLKQGWDVCCVTMDFGQKEGERINGFKVHKSFGVKEGFFGVRFVYPRLFKTWNALKRADADVYYVRCAGYLAGVVAAFCRLYKKRFVFAGAHDTDFIPSELQFPSLRDKLFYEFGLQRADAIIVQSQRQKVLLRENYRLSAEVIPNFHPWSARRLDSSQRKYVLWVSRIKDWKRPEQFIKLSESFPAETFIMIGGRPENGDNGFFEKMRKLANGKKNLRFLGFQPLEVTEAYFEQCKVFINTSVYEGFPNTFLQAWRRGIPVISYVDPDSVVSRRKLGMVVNSEEGLAETLNAVLSILPEYESDVLRYFVENHSEKVADRYSVLFGNLL